MASKPTKRVLAGHRARNAALTQRAVELGADLAEKRPIDFHFHAYGHEAAITMGIDLYEFGLTLTGMWPSKDGAGWNVEARGEVSIDQAVAADTTERLAALAANAGGEFDGIGFSVAPTVDQGRSGSTR